MGCCESYNMKEIPIREICILNIVKKCKYDPIVSNLSIMIINHIELFPNAAITAVCLSAKFLCDDTVSLSALADLMNITKKQFENNESTILKKINWNLWKFTKILI